jgi:hypothetical protein
MTTELRKIMGEASASYDQDTLLSQRRQSASNAEVVLRSKIRLHGQLKDGNVSAWVSEQQWHPRAVIKSAIVVDLGVEPSLAKKLDNVRGHFGRAWRGIT